jgi:hypothetical protein
MYTLTTMMTVPTLEGMKLTGHPISSIGHGRRREISVPVFVMGATGVIGSAIVCELLTARTRHRNGAKSSGDPTLLRNSRWFFIKRIQSCHNSHGRLS